MSERERKLNTKNIIDKEIKLKNWGEGPWVHEPDYAEFEHEGIKCIVKRIAFLDGPNREHLDGGHFCGYVEIPKSHTLHGLEDYFPDLDVHGGITFNEIDSSGEHWVGFDCAHSCDLVPSLEKVLMEAERRICKCSMFNPTYKDLSFVIEETKSLATQLVR